MMSVFIMCAHAEESLMQFEKAADMDMSHIQGHQQTNRMMENGKAMEAQWKAMVQQIVDNGGKDPVTGTPWVPKNSLLDPVENAIAGMEGELVHEEGLNTGIMGSHVQHIQTCNADRDAAIVDALALQGTANGKGSDHHSCRLNDEYPAIASMEAECNAFNNKVASCGQEQDWYAAYDEGATGSGTLNDLVASAVSCKANVAEVAAKAPVCDTKQGEFHTAWCAFKSHTEAACSAHNSCYTLAVENYNAARNSIQGLETEQKTIFRMLARIRCYLQLLVRKNTDGSAYVPQQSDIDACQNSPITADQQSHLNVDYGSVDGPGKCLDSDGLDSVDDSVSPGSPTWLARLGANTHSELSPVAACA
jgi:hypothetical protein